MHASKVIALLGILSSLLIWNSPMAHAGVCEDAYPTRQDFCQQLHSIWTSEKSCKDIPGVSEKHRDLCDFLRLLGRNNKGEEAAQQCSRTFSKKQDQQKHCEEIVGWYHYPISLPRPALAHFDPDSIQAYVLGKMADEYGRRPQPPQPDCKLGPHSLLSKQSIDIIDQTKTAAENAALLTSLEEAFRRAYPEEKGKPTEKDIQSLRDQMAKLPKLEADQAIKIEFDLNIHGKALKTKGLISAEGRTTFYFPKAVVGRGGQKSILFGIDYPNGKPKAVSIHPNPGEQEWEEFDALRLISKPKDFPFYAETSLNGQKEGILIQPLRKGDWYHLMNLHSNSGLLSELRGYRDAVALSLLTQVKTLHQNGIMHRDIKPDNILWDYDEKGRITPFLADLGLSVKFDPTHDYHNITPAGSHGFIPPETYTEGPRNAKAQDIFALAFSLYRLTESSQAKQTRYNSRYGCILPSYLDPSGNIDAKKQVTALASLPDFDGDNQEFLCRVCGVFCTRPRNPFDRFVFQMMNPSDPDARIGAFNKFQEYLQKTLTSKGTQGTPE